MSLSTAWTEEEALVHHSFSPRLAEALTGIFPIDIPITDYGCGLGNYVAFLNMRGFEVTGIEGHDMSKYAISRDIIIADISKSFPQRTSRNSLCLEVAEHIDPSCEDAFIANITAGCMNTLVLSWARPGQGGHGHVNEKHNIEVIPIIEKEGFRLDLPETLWLRKEMQSDPCWWFSATLFIFRRV